LGIEYSEMFVFLIVPEKTQQLFTVLLMGWFDFLQTLY